MRNVIYFNVFLSLSLITASFSCNSQDLLRNYTLRKGDVETFVMGVSPDTSETKILILPDNKVKMLMNKAGKSYLQFNTSGFTGSTLQARWERLNVTIDGKGKLKENYGPYTVGFDKLSGSRTLLVGNVVLKSGDRKKIKWLDLDAGVGMSNLSTFKKLETVYVNHDVFNPSLSIGSEPFNFYYPGDLFFWQPFYAVPSLKSVYIDIDQNSLPYQVGLVSFLDAPNDSLVSLPRLHALHLQNSDYFSVDFDELKKLDYLALSGLQQAEMINLAVVMHSFGKDAKSGDWARYLEKADVSRLPSIPIDGSYESFYANGKKLCAGSFSNGKPDGTWRFWNETGKIVQERFYANGSRTGTWIFRAESTDEPEADAFLIMTYENDQLIMRTEYARGEAFYFNEGYDRQNGTPAVQITRITIRRGPEVNVTRTIDVINQQDYKKNPHGHSDYPLAYYGDTIKGVHDEYTLSNGGWTYSTAFFCESCGDAYSYRFDFRGKTGQQAYFNSKTTYKTMPRREQIITIDLEECIFHQLEEETVGKEIKLTEFERAINPKEWKCNEPE